MRSLSLIIVILAGVFLAACGALSPGGPVVQEPTDQVILGLSYSIPLIAIGYLVLLAVRVRDTSYLYYVLFLGCFTLAHIIHDGLDQQYPSPDLSGWRMIAIPLLVAGMLIGILKFTSTFLMTGVYMPRFHQAIRILLAGMGLFIALIPFAGPPVIAYAEGSAVALICAAVLAASWRAWRLGDRPARYLLLAWPILGIVVSGSTLIRYDIAPDHALIEQGQLLGSLIIALCWALALIERQRGINAEQDLARTALLREQQEALRVKDTLNTSLRQANEELTRTVAERERMEAAEQGRQYLLEQVLHLGKAVAQLTELRACLLKIYWSIREGLGFDRVGLFLYDAERQILHGSFGTDRSGALQEEWGFIHPGSLSYDILSDPSGFRFTPNYKEAFRLPPDHEMAGVTAHITVAAWAGDARIGMIAADNLLTQRPISEAQIEALRLFAGYAGLAIANARLLAQVRAAEQQHRSIVEHAVEGIFQTTPDGRFLRANPALARIYGYATPEELIEQIVDIEHQVFVEPARWIEFQRIVVAEGEVRGFEHQSYRRDGSVIWVSMNARVVYDAAGAIQYFEGSIEDISERKQAEKALRESAALLRRHTMLLEKTERTAQVGGWELDVATAELYWTAETYRIHETSPDEYTPTLETAIGFYTPESAALISEAVQVARVSGRPYDLELEIITARKNRIWVRTTGTAQWRDGHPEKIYGSFQNIDDRKRAAAAIERYAVRMSILHEIDRAILAAHSPEEIAAAALSRIRELVPSQRASVVVFDPAGGQARIIAVNINSPTIFGVGRRIPLEIFTRLTSLYNGHPFYLEDLLLREDRTPVGDQLLAEGVRAVLVIPLIAYAEPIGVLMLGSSEPGSFTAEHLEITREVSDQLVIAMRQARLLAQTTESLAREQRLNEVARIINQSLELDTVIPNVVRLTAELVNAESAAMGMVTPDGQKLAAPYVFNYPDSLGRDAIPREAGGLGWYIAATGEPVLVDDYQSHPAAAPNQPWIKGFVGAPVIAGNVALGVLYCFNTDPARRFSPRDLALVESIGRQAGVAIQNARLFAAEQRRVALLTALYDIGLAVSAQLDLPALLQTLLDRAGQLLGTSRGALYRLGADRQTLDCVAVLPDTSMHSPLRFGEGMVGRVAQTGEPLVIADYQAWAGRLATFDDSPARAIVGMPIVWDEQVLGVILIADLQANRFGTAEVETLRLLAAQAAVAIQNAQLFAAARRQLQELSILQALAQAGTEAGDEDSLIARATEIIGAGLFQDYCGVLLVDEAAGALRVHPSHRGINEDLKHSLVPLGQGITGAVALRGQPWNVPEVLREPAYLAANPVMRSELCVPLKAGEQIIGVINVESAQEHAFSQADERLLVTCARQLATAIERRRAAAERDQLYHEAQDAIQHKDEALALLDTLLESAPIGMAFLDRDLRFLRINDAMAQLNGFPSQEHLGQTIEELLPEMAPTLVPLMRRVLATGEPIVDLELSNDMPGLAEQHLELSNDMLGLAEQQRHWLASYYPVRDRDARVLGIGAAVIDITERKGLEAQLFQAQRMESVGQLAGGIAHDFNNLLTAVTGYAELARDSLAPENHIRADIEEILKASDRAANLTRQLLAFARRQVIEPHVLNLNVLILEVNKLLRRLIGEDIELVTLLAPDLGLVKVDPGQIEQVLINMAVNARHAMPNGGKLTIETRNVLLDADTVRQYIGLEPGPYVFLAMTDTGIGMDREIQEHIFEPFFTTKGPGQGTGLGLATCYGIIKQHNGNISAHSEPGYGSTFKIHLPSVSASEPDLPPRDERPTLPHGSEIVLLAEDEPAVRAMAVRILRQQGYRVLEAAHGDEALRLAHEQRAEPIALLLTDMVMPHMGGKPLAEQITVLYPDIKVLFMSGYTDSAVAPYQANTTTAFLQKPFSPATLASKVREVLDS